MFDGKLELGHEREMKEVRTTKILIRYVNLGMIAFEVDLFHTAQYF